MRYLLMLTAMLLLVTGCKPGSGKNREEICETDMTENGQVVKNTPVVNIADSIRLYFTFPAKSFLIVSISFSIFLQGAHPTAPNSRNV